MNFYFGWFLVVICFGVLVSPSKIYLCPEKNRGVEKPKEISKKVDGDTGFPIMNGLVRAASQARSWAQWMRKLLKALRKWCHSHPPEVKLGKCFASYFNIKIPGLRRDKKISRVIEDTSVTEYPRKMSKKFKIKPEAFGECASQTKTFTATSLGNIFFFLAQFRNKIFRNDLVVCMWDYIWKKFWSWVDSAPDFHDLLRTSKGTIY